MQGLKKLHLAFDGGAGRHLWDASQLVLAMLLPEMHAHCHLMEQREDHLFREITHV